MAAVTIGSPTIDLGSDHHPSRIHPEFRSGILAMLPLLGGVAPIGLLVGATIANHTDAAASLAGTWLIYGASAHLAFMQLTGDGAGTTLVVLTCVLINARLIVYSASLGSHWRDESAPFKAVMAFTIVDPSFALGDDRYRKAGDADAKRAFYMGAAATLWIGWSLLIGVGMAIGNRFGQPPVLELALPLCLVVMVAPALVKRPACFAVAVSAAVGLLCHSLPSGIGLLAAIVAGAVAGSVAEGRTP